MNISKRYNENGVNKTEKKLKWKRNKNFLYIHINKNNEKNLRK